jgi:glycosyltransferase involved in cell wall biosynthesis
MKIAIISCYDQIDYVRTLVLRPGFAAAPNVETIIVKNEKRGLIRYLEVPYKILLTKFKDKPDAYVITFRGYEMLPFVLMIKGGKPLIFDEFINAAEYLQEHNTLALNSTLGKIFRRWYTGLLKRCRFILADTQAHADYSSQLCGVDINKYVALPVGTDETVFYPGAATYTPDKNGKFRVFSYGAMPKLHGIEYFLEAAVMLAKTHPNVEFVLSDPKGKKAAAFQAAKDKGANIKVLEGWINFKDLPKLEIEADLCVGGHFGQTLQSQFVIATKTYQYLACEAPALVGRNKATDGFVDKKNCLLVEPGNAQAIAEAIGWAAEHPAELRQIGCEGRKLYEERFSNTKINQKIAEMVARL